MAEYIDRKEAKAALKKLYRESDMLDEWKSGVLDSFVLIDNIHAADVRPVEWKSVREHTPEPGRYLTCRKTSTIPRSYYQSILSYTDNLESVDEYDFEGENVPGWFEYDSEYGYYSCDNVEWFMPLPPMPTNCGAKMEES